MLGDLRHEVMFVMCQAKGWAVIQASERAEGFVRIDLDGRMYEIRAKVMSLAGYSGHADQDGLVSFAIGARAAGRVLFVHGEPSAKQALARALRSRVGHMECRPDVIIP